MQNNSQCITLPPRDCHTTKLDRTKPSNSHRGPANTTFRVLPNRLMDGSNPINETGKQQSRPRKPAIFTIPAASTNSPMPAQPDNFRPANAVRSIQLHPTGNRTEPKTLLSKKTLRHQSASSLHQEFFRRRSGPPRSSASTASAQPTERQSPSIAHNSILDRPYFCSRDSGPLRSNSLAPRYTR